jgi:biotin carboxyl carrier protein
MRKFIVTVNGKSYEVEVEELGNKTITLENHPSIPVTTPQVSQPKEEKAPETKQNSQSIPSGADTIKAPMPGTILDIKVNAGDSVTKGQVLAILEAMKMENEIMAPRDGKVVSIQVSKGSSVNAGDVLLALQ